MARDYSRWLEDSTNPDVKEFVEGGGYGTFAGWWGSGENRGFMTSNNDGRPPGGSYFKDGKYFTVSGTDQRMVPPDYELIGIDEAVVDGDVGAQHATPGRMILKRKERPAPPAAPAVAAAPAPAPAPQAPAPRIDASTPSLADALKAQGEQRQQRPALQDALNSALRLNGQDAQERPDADAADLSGTDQQGEADRSDRRFAASDRWRQRLAEATGRFA